MFPTILPYTYDATSGIKSAVFAMPSPSVYANALAAFSIVLLFLFYTFVGATFSTSTYSFAYLFANCAFVLASIVVNPCV